MKLSVSESGVTAKLSVRELVGFVRRSGSLGDSNGMDLDGMSEGRAVHRALQTKLAGEINNYAAEVRMSLSRLVRGVGITLSGIADGVFFKDGSFTIDEIKTITGSSGSVSAYEYERHLSQAKCYALMLCESRKLESIGVRLLYVYPSEKRTEIKDFRFSHAELSEFYHEILCEFIDIADISVDRIKRRRNGARELRFPFSKLRAGQRELIRESYAAIKGGHNLFASAPTGIGKTMSVIYPSVKALGADRADKIFYLTPKGSIQKNAEEAIALLQKNGTFLKSITITAKKKMCIDKRGDCDCEDCVYAEDYYDRVAGAKKELLALDGHITSDTVLTIGKKYRVCPFELSLDTSLACDFIVCDYNYVFDPKVNLKRYSDKSEKFIVLADEAHNLIERVRNSYSASLQMEDFEEKLPFIGNNSRLLGGIDAIRNAFCRKDKELSEGESAISFAPPEEMTMIISDFMRDLSDFLDSQELEYERKKALTELFFLCRDFVMAYERYDSACATICGEGGKTEIYLVDPSEKIRETVEKWGVGIFFSATLLPQEYCFQMLGGDETSGDVFIDIPSPFDSDNFPVIARAVSTRFNDRQSTVAEISDLIHSAIQKKGNYMVFFPSYDYQNSVSKDYSHRYKDARIILQRAEMSAEERRAFLADFTSEKREETLVGFAVLGGAFSEGIDLVGEALSGVVIVGVGLPPPSAEKEAISHHFSELEQDGRAIAYLLPGFNKVLQAAGRVIRSESDRGFLILCDDRFCEPEYIELFPQSFENFSELETNEAVSELLYEFWN